MVSEILEGVIPFKKVPKLKKVPSRVGGEGIITTWEHFPSFGTFYFEGSP